MSVDPNWGRWIFASISDAFNQVALNNQIPLFIEGSDENTDVQLEYFEFRTDGPYFKELSKDFWKVWVNVNVFCASKRQKENFHRIHVVTGLATSMFANSIGIFKFGTGIGDDSTSVTCMVLESRNKEDVIVSHFGQVGTDLLEMQATVDGCYIGYIDNGS
jgi:hypothetical protein